jgi:hypothetical protein
MGNRRMRKTNVSMEYQVRRGRRNVFSTQYSFLRALRRDSLRRVLRVSVFNPFLSSV